MSGVTHNIKVLQWNSNSVVHLQELRAHLSNQDISPHLICLQETWVKSTDRLPKIPNYVIAANHCRHRDNKKGGGVTIYVKNGIPYEPLDLNFNDPFLEVSSIILNLHSEKITLLNCYDPPPSQDPISRSTEKYQKLIDLIPTQNYLLLGDLNAHTTLWSSKRDTRGAKLHDLTTDSDLVILNTGEPTMADFNTSPDLTLATPQIGAKCEWSVLDNPCNSDHLPIIINIRAKCDTMGTSARQKWKLDKADWEMYRSLCHKIKVDPLKNVDEMAEEFANSIKKVCEKSIPKTSSKQRKIRPPLVERCMHASVTGP